MTTIVLVGLMGSGKSTVGSIVAAELGCRLIDSDRAIEQRTGSTVREHWEQGGEAAYRHLESEVVLDALSGSGPVVIAAPGGVILDPSVRDAMGAAEVIWLRGRPATLASRVGPADHRPLLGDDPLAVLSRLAEQRAALYEGVADAIIDVDREDPEAIAAHVLEFHARRRERPC